MKTIEFIKLANKKRLENKNQWVFLNEYVNEIPVAYKAFNTWIQVIKYNGIRSGSTMNQNVSEFKKYLLNIIESNKNNRSSKTMQRQEKLQKEVDESFNACRCDSEWAMCKVSIEKDLEKLGYILTEYRKVQKLNNHI